MSNSHYASAHLPKQVVQTALEAISSINIHDEADSYEWRGEGGDYTPQPHEKAMLEDFGHGLISLIEDAIRPLTPTPSALADHWHGISSFGERELGRLIVVGAFDGKGRLCATVRRLQQPIGCHSNSPASLKKAMRLKWEPTHFMELTAPYSAIPSASLTNNDHPPVCCMHCNDTAEVKLPDSEFVSQCPVCAQTSHAALNLSKDKSND